MAQEAEGLSYKHEDLNSVSRMQTKEMSIYDTGAGDMESVDSLRLPGQPVWPLGKCGNSESLCLNQNKMNGT